LRCHVAVYIICVVLDMASHARGCGLIINTHNSTLGRQALTYMRLI
jgi:hypothetical protein